ncbi:hypothetical protein HOLleu_10574 [Holothuria leucospilota]|uniref:Uncharacterized protein n=1 Tax=Holothuria leucospilota TaxID=206669 RepID=A0A9Q1CEH6_HOLLE|nr:hypothetical protein HOLleu_10574 [Holothuria leucospilota]
MRRSGAKMYVWPACPDVSWEALESVVCSVGFPDIANNREHFTFDTSDIETRMQKCIEVSMMYVLFQIMP